MRELGGLWMVERTTIGSLLSKRQRTLRFYIFGRSLYCWQCFIVCSMEQISRHLGTDLTLLYAVRPISDSDSYTKRSCCDLQARIAARNGNRQ